MKVSAINFYQVLNHKYLKKEIKNNDISSKKINSLDKNHYNTASPFIQYSNATSFKGITAKGLVKQRGIFTHITSLPGTRSFCGQFGDIQTTKFINWLAAAKQTHWIMNPLNALEDNLCPYSSAGRFSRNKFIVNLNKLTGEEYGDILKESELPEDITAPSFTLEMLEKQKNPRFELAYKRFKNLDVNSPIKLEYKNFVAKNDKLWLEDYANFDLISKKFGANWQNWDKKLQTAPEKAKEKGVELNSVIFSILKNKDKSLTKAKFEDGIGLFKFEQFLYDKQFHELVDELNTKGIRLIMDLPIGVSATGVDTWGKKDIFLLDKDFKPTHVSGCPSEGARSVLYLIKRSPTSVNFALTIH